jgi:hypothetical protein
MKFLANVSPMKKGIAALVLGAFLFLHATNMFVINNFFVVIISLVLMGYGLHATGLLAKIMALFKKK